MQKWKYKVEFIKISSFSKVETRSQPIAERLTRLGMEGWELVDVIKDTNSYHVTLYLKQPY
ncbi:MAG: hypothetical protein V3U82_04120 [Robiginitomaculum sp.]